MERIRLGIIGCSTIAFRKLPLKEALRTISRLGFKTVDIGILGTFCTHYIENEKEIMEILREEDLGVSTLNIGLGGLNHPQVAEKEFEFIRTNIVTANHLGCYGVTISPGVPVDGDWEKEATKVVKKMQELAEYGEKYNVEVSVEIPHRGTLVQNEEELSAFCRLADRGYISYTLDTSHFFYCVKRQPSEFPGYFPAGSIGHVHLRDANEETYMLTPGEGKIDFKDFFEKIEESHYKRSFVLELEFKEKSTDETIKELNSAADFIKRFLD